MIIDCISDFHGHYPKLDGGDILIIAGDLTARDTEKEYEEFSRWLNTLAYRKVIVIAGNHDNYLMDCEKTCVKPLFYDPSYVEYLCDSGTEFEYEEEIQEEHKFKGIISYNQKRKLKIWGIPWTKTFPGMNPHCKAFTCDTEEELSQKWDKIPEDVDILITHSPPIGVLDRTVDDKVVGSVSLSAQLGFLNNLKVHIFGHIHESYGKIDPTAYLPNYFDVCKHYSINASHVNERYQPVNKPIRVIL